jgi:tRNA G18 (ribose-2'-O)-methylase SpoU
MTDITGLKNENQLKVEMSKWNVRDDLKGKTVEEIRNSYQPRGFAVALFNVDGGLNIGSIIRTATIFCADCVYLIGDKRYDRRSTVGAHNYIDIHHIDISGLNDRQASIKAIDKIQMDGYQVCPIEQGGEDICDNDGFIYTYRPCFVFGSEKDGIPEQFTKIACNVYSIYQPGVIRSLNVSACAGIVIWEWIRNRRQ